MNSVPFWFLLHMTQPKHPDSIMSNKVGYPVVAFLKGNGIEHLYLSDTYPEDAFRDEQQAAWPLL